MSYRIKTTRRREQGTSSYVTTEATLDGARVVVRELLGLEEDPMISDSRASTFGPSRDGRVVVVEPV